MTDEQKVSLVVHNPSLLQANEKCTQPEKVLQAAEPLWKRVPTRDLSGKPYFDFMMVIPGLRNFEENRLRDTINKIEIVLTQFQKYIILADLNLKINVLWVTLQPHQGLTGEITSLIHHVVPEAKLVSEQAKRAN